jgi:C_GCAxxG_C_C family probable redox protein
MEEWSEKISDRAETALSLFKKGFTCSQAVLGAYCDLFGLDREAALRMATGFGGGMGRMGLTCGAVTGAFMVIGLKYGAARAEERQDKEKTHEIIREFSRRFAERHGAVSCRELIRCDLSNPEGYQKAKEMECFSKICPQLVKDAAKLVESMVC